MQLSLLPFSLVLSVVVAQTSSVGTTSACAAQPVLEACLASTQAIAAGCSSTDYQCLCQKTNDVLTCFQQCPNDPRQSSILSNKETYCADASIYSSAAPTSAISRPVSSDVSAATTLATTTGGSAQTTTDPGAVKTASNTASSAAATATGKNGASRDIMIGAGGMMVGLAGLFGVLL